MSWPERAQAIGVAWLIGFVFLFALGLLGIRPDPIDASDPGALSWVIAVFTETALLMVPLSAVALPSGLRRSTGRSLLLGSIAAVVVVLMFFGRLLIDDDRFLVTACAIASVPLLSHTVGRWLALRNQPVVAVTLASLGALVAVGAAGFVVSAFWGLMHGAPGLARYAMAAHGSYFAVWFGFILGAATVMASAICVGAAVVRAMR